MTDSKQADAPVEIQAEPDLKKLATALRAEAEGKAKQDARAHVKSMPGTWEHLPVGLRSAIRFDVSRLASAGKSKEEIVRLGYSDITASRALRDLGLRD